MGLFDTVKRVATGAAAKIPVVVRKGARDVRNERQGFAVDAFARRGREARKKPR